MKRSLQGLGLSPRSRSINSALRRTLRAGAPFLLVMPSTGTTVTFARALCAQRRCLVTAGPVVSQPQWGLTQYLCTPAQIVRKLAGQSALPVTVISFPDQLAGEDSSFASLQFLGQERRFSLFEALLALRHRPSVLAFRSGPFDMTFGLLPLYYQDLLELPCDTKSLLLLMKRLLSQLEAELAQPPVDWLAARCFALKSPAAFDFQLREELKDVEALLRLGLLSCNGDRERLAALLDAVMAPNHTRETPCASQQVA